jgi:predicted transposase YbfD/YdcC
MHYIVKKTLQVIINQGCDYLVKVKGNERNLFKAAKQITENTTTMGHFNEVKRTRGRNERRFVSLFASNELIPQGWPSLNRIIHVERIFSSKKGYHHTHSYYASSLLSDDAQLFACGIRGHWKIENNLHWVKDVVLKEDITRHRGLAARNMSILRNIAINVFRKNEYSSIKHATLFFASNVKELLEIIFRT